MRVSEIEACFQPTPGAASNDDDKLVGIGLALKSPRLDHPLMLDFHGGRGRSCETITLKENSKITKMEIFYFEYVDAVVFTMSDG